MRQLKLGQEICNFVKCTLIHQIERDLWYNPAKLNHFQALTADRKQIRKSPGQYEYAIVTTPEVSQQLTQFIDTHNKHSV